MRAAMASIHRGIGVTCPSWLVATPNGGCIDPTLVKAGTDLPYPVQVATDYPQAPGCHVIDLASNTCMLDDGTIEGCNIIRECDPLTGLIHCQYGGPGTPVPGIPICPSGGPITFNPVPIQNLTGGTPYIPQVQTPPSPVIPPSVPYGGLPPSSTPPASSTPAGDGTGTQSTSTGFNPMGFLTEATFAGIPNWVWLAGGAVLFMMVKR